MEEKFILNIENERLSSTWLIAERVRDETGCDIKPWDQYKKEIYIEMKTTTGGRESIIFLIMNEHFSSLNDGNYWIYMGLILQQWENEGEIK